MGDARYYDRGSRLAIDEAEIRCLDEALAQEVEDLALSRRQVVKQLSGLASPREEFG